jgi:hypothetical protein
MARDAVKISRNLDDNALDNVLFANLSDGTDVLAINTDGSVNATVSATDLDIRDLNSATDSVTVVATNLDIRDLSSATDSVTVLATDLDIRDLSHAQDSVKVGDGTDFVAVNTDGSLNITDNGGSITVDGTVAATQSGTWNIATLTSITNDVNIADGGNSITVDDGGGSLTVDGTVAVSGSVTVTATDLDIRDLSHTQDSVKVGDGTDLLAVNNDGSINVVVTGGTAGTPVLVTSEASLASAASSNHDYTASGGAFKPSKVQVSSESIATFEILTGPTGTLVSRGKIRTSVEHPSEVFIFPDGFSIANTEVVRVVRTNDSNKTRTVNSSISGEQL